MLGIFRSRRQKLFDRYRGFVEVAAPSGAVYGFLLRNESGERAKAFLETFQNWERAVAETIPEKHQDDARQLVEEFFADASEDEDLYSCVTEQMAEKAKAELVRDTAIAIATPRTNPLARPGAR